MANRISFTQISGRILDRLFTNYNKLEDIQTQLATGKKLDKPSDDPVAATQSLELRSSIDQISTYQRNVDDGLAYMGTVDTTLQTANNLYQSLRENAIQASNDTNSAESRYYIGQDVRGSFDQMVALSNTTFKGQFVFSGSNSQEAPYTMTHGQSGISSAPVAGSGDSAYPGLNTWIQLVDKNVSDSNDNANKMANTDLAIPGTLKISGLTEGTDYQVDYRNGKIQFLSAAANTMMTTTGATVTYDWLRRSEKNLDGVANREIDEGVTAQINTTATDAFGPKNGANTWGAMIDLLDGTLNNKPDKIRGAVDELDQAQQRNLTAQSTNGARVQRFDSTKSSNQERSVYTTQLQSDTEDVDFAQAISDFNLQQAVYDASLKMGARALQDTLINFL